MIFIVHSGPYWTPKIATRLLELIQEHAGDGDGLIALRRGIDSNAASYDLAVWTHQAYLDAEPIIRSSRSMIEYDVFESQLIDILKESRRPARATDFKSEPMPSFMN